MIICLEALEDWARDLLGKLEPAARNTLARSIGQALRRSQQQRIIAQRNADGSKYAPRKHRNLRGKQGRTRRKIQMFQRVRTVQLMRIKSDNKLISIGFAGRVARITRVHQFGLRDRACNGAPYLRYQRRELLGFNEEDLEVIRDTMLSHLT